MARSTGLLVCLVALLSLAACDKLFGSGEPVAPPPPVVAPAPPPEPVAPVAPVEVTPTAGASDKGNPVAAAPDKPDPTTVNPPPPDRAAQRQARGRCENTCQYANDGECDDGRPNAHTGLCGLGTDCNDCGRVGQRFRKSSGPTAGMCTNTCQHARDGECDDGRPNSHTNVCGAGTDCADCGPWGRAFTRAGAGGGGGGAVAAGTCSNTCQHANDGECDDGRPNSHTDVCAAGTDCADCGPWGRAFRQQTGGACTNTCQHARDGECDDGRPGSHTDLCARGTDCADCGPA